MNLCRHEWKPLPNYKQILYCGKCLKTIKFNIIENDVYFTILNVHLNVDNEAEVCCNILNEAEVCCNILNEVDQKLLDEL